MVANQMNTGLHVHARSWTWHGHEVLGKMWRRHGHGHGVKPVSAYLWFKGAINIEILQKTRLINFGSVYYLQYCENM